MIRRQKILTPEKALVRLEELCARSEQCSSDAKKKLQTWGINPDDSKEIIDALIARRFIDDERFCRAYVRDKFHFAHWGKRKIEISLLMKRLDKEMVRKALEAIDEKEYIESLRAIIASKARTMSDADSYEGRTRLFRFAASRGYEPNLIADVLRKIK